ncbi:MAG: hypothetical protein ACR2FS_15915 [Phormidesmis sp.]
MTSTPPTSRSARVRGTLSDLLGPGFLWPVVWIAILVTAGGVSLRAVTVMTRNPPLPDCTQAASFDSDSERLLCAQASVQSGSAQAIIEAIELVAPWPSSHPLYGEANRLMNQWSRALLEELEEMVQRGEIRQAKALAGRIPERVESYSQVEDAIAQWDAEWETGREFEAKVTQAIAAQNWTGARRATQDIKVLNTRYWVITRHNQLKEKIDREETARRQLNQARTLAKSGDLQKLGEALAIAQGMNLETAAWEDAKPDVDRWAKAVLQYSFKKWEEEDIDAAIAIVQLVPPDLTLTSEAQDLVRFGHAQQLAVGHYDQWLPSYAQVYNLLEAIRAVQQISPVSPFYEEAQASLTQWQQKLTDMVQLQYASTLAQIGQRASYRMAIAEAEQITQERPQRVQAQTLVSHWQKEIERIEDRPILSRAVQLASAGGKANLRSAITEANKVDQGRALRIQGQTYIAEWLDRIEIIEDQPILTKAEQLADGGKLKQAIAEAQKVAKGRALRDQAQAAIKTWTGELETIEDRPILVRAENLAARGSLTAAIEVASQIAPGRALYSAARSSIAIWTNERAYIWSLEAPAVESYADEAPYPAEEGYSDDSYSNDGYSDSYNNDF